MAITSPRLACTPRKSRVPVARSALDSRPAMKSSFTHSRASPWNVKRGRKPIEGKNVLALATSP